MPTVTVNGVIVWNGGVMTGSGTTLARNGFTVRDQIVTLLGTRQFVNGGAATVGSGSVFANTVGASFTMSSSGSISGIGPGAGTFRNAGVFTQDAPSGITTIGVPYTSTAWWPAQLGTVNSLAIANGDPERLVALPGQFRSPTGAMTGTERVYGSMTYDVYYSTGRRLPPVVRSIQTHYDSTGHLADFTVDAAGKAAPGEAAPAIVRVVVTWTDSAGTSGRWQSLDLTQAAGLWTGSLTSIRSIDYFVQIVDANGNLVQEGNKGLYYQVSIGMGTGTAITLVSFNSEGSKWASPAALPSVEEAIYGSIAALLAGGASLFMGLRRRLSQRHRGQGRPWRIGGKE